MRKEFSIDEARDIGQNIGVDFSKVDIEQFRLGLAVELEHGSMWGEATNITNDDPLATGRIVWAHLKEIGDYYTRLQNMENQAES